MTLEKARPDEVRCQTCAFVHVKLDAFAPVDHCSCRRYPPPNSNKIWPPVDATSWCGEWLPLSSWGKRVPRKR